MLQLFELGLVAGSLYALLASGFSLIYTTNRFVHFAHGAVMTAGAYAFATLIAWNRIPLFFIPLLTVAVSALVGLGVYEVVYAPLRKQHASKTVLLIASLGAMIGLVGLMQIVFGSDVKTVFIPWFSRSWLIGSVVITRLHATIILTAFCVTLLVHLGMKYTKTGWLLRAVADNPELATTTGIPVHRLEALSMSIGSALAGIAAMGYALLGVVEPNMGVGAAVKGFTGAIIGGTAFVPGAALGGMLVGLIENVGQYWLPSGYKDAMTFVTLLIFLVWRPKGIFGIDTGTK
jgi:branched-chain amino acid transport system permease protein